MRPDSGFSDKKEGLEEANEDATLDIGDRLQNRFALQQITLQCMAMHDLDAVTYPTSNIPAPKLGAPTEPTVNGRPSNAGLCSARRLPGHHGAGGIHDPGLRPRVRRGGEGRHRAVGPIEARLPVGIDFLGGRSTSRRCFGSPRPTRPPRNIAHRRRASGP